MENKDTPNVDSKMEDSFKEILDEMYEIFLKKNSDYGGAVDVTYLVFGDVVQLVRLWDKLLRLTQLQLSHTHLVKEENYEDTFIDLANYSVIALAQRKSYKGSSEELGNVFKQFIDGALRKRGD